MKKKDEPVEKRIPDIATAERCINSAIELVSDEESPLFAEDLMYSIKLISNEKVFQLYKKWIKGDLQPEDWK